jgi:hypothetical protein
LMEEEYRVHLANPAAIQQYSGLKYTDDHSEGAFGDSYVPRVSPL